MVINAASSSYNNPTPQFPPPYQQLQTNSTTPSNPVQQELPSLPPPAVPQPMKPLASSSSNPDGDQFTPSPKAESVTASNPDPLAKIISTAVPSLPTSVNNLTNAFAPNLPAQAMPLEQFKPIEIKPTAEQPIANAQPPAQTTQSLPGAPTQVNGTTPAVPINPLSAKPLTPAQQTGQQVGQSVTKLLEEVPALQEKAGNIDWESISLPRLERTRIKIGPVVNHLPDYVLKRLADALPDIDPKDPGNTKALLEFKKWMHQPPDPEVLHQIRKEEAAKKAEEGKTKSTHHTSTEELEDDYDYNDEADTEKKTIGDRVRSKYGDLKSHIPFHNKEKEPPLKPGKSHAKATDDDLDPSDDDLEFLK
jgi:hypothetical protein